MSHRLLVRNLSADTPKWRIEEIFGTVADVASVAIMGTEAKVELASPEAAKDCLERFHGSTIEGRVVSVVFDAPHVPAPRALKKRSKVALRKAGLIQ